MDGRTGQVGELFIVEDAVFLRDAGHCVETLRRVCLTGARQRCGGTYCDKLAK